jgi:hypothetical protein
VKEGQARFVRNALGTPLKALLNLTSYRPLSYINQSFKNSA